jgi:hypothetical protein
MESLIPHPVLEDVDGHATAFSHLKDAHQKCTRFFEMRDQSEWKLLDVGSADVNREDDISLYSMSIDGSSVKACKVEFVVNAPLKDVYRFFNDFECIVKYDPR